MAKLVLKRFQCVEDTSEIGGESPYFITWVGNLDDPAKSTLRISAKAYWNNNVDKGPGAWPVELVTCPELPSTPSKALALAIMVEKDEGRDITTDEVEAMRKSMEKALRTWVEAGVFDSSHVNFVSTMKNTFESLVKGKLASSDGADDDVMEEDNWRAARRIVLTGKNEELALVTFKGGTGQYNVRYAREA